MSLSRGSKVKWYLVSFIIIFYISFTIVTFFQYEINEGNKIKISEIISGKFNPSEFFGRYPKFLNPNFSVRKFIKFEGKADRNTKMVLGIAGFIIALFLLKMFSKVKNDWKGIEHGSAEWGNSRDRIKYKLNNEVDFSYIITPISMKIEQFKTEKVDAKKEKLKSKEKEIKIKISEMKNRCSEIKKQMKNPNLTKEQKIELKKKIKRPLIERVLIRMTKANFYKFYYKHYHGILGKYLPRIDEINFTRNIILSETEYLPVDDRAIFRNLNILVVGGSGAGKSRYFVKPNILGASMNMVLTDPKGELYQDTHKELEALGYKTYRLNLNDLGNSDCYNPFKYIRKPSDIAILVETLIKNTNEAGNKGDFWEKSEKALFMTIAHYHFESYKNNLRKEALKRYEELKLNLSLKDKEDKILEIEEELKRNNEVRLPTLVDILNSVTQLTEDEEGKKEPSKIIKELNMLKEGHPAKIFFDTYNLGEDKVKSSIKISLAVRLAFVGDQSLQKLVSEDNFNLDEVNVKKAIYVIISDSNSAFNSLAGLFFSQLFQVLYYNADRVPSKRLPIPYQFYLDEFANIGQINSFSEILATCRGRRIGIVPIIQSMAQLEKLYEKNAPTIIGNCDTLLYLGGNDSETAEKISKMIGNVTVNAERQGKSQSFGSQKSMSTSDNISAVGRALITLDELKRLKDTDSIVLIRGFKPFMSQKLNVDKFYDGLQEEIFIRKNIAKELKDKNLKEDSNNFNNIKEAEFEIEELEEKVNVEF